MEAKRRQEEASAPEKAAGTNSITNGVANGVANGTTNGFDEKSQDREIEKV
jgi:hypothetical protein